MEVTPTVGDLTGFRRIQEANAPDPVLDVVFRSVEEGNLHQAAYKLQLDYDKLCHIRGSAKAILDSGLIRDDSFRVFLERKITRGWDD